MNLGMRGLECLEEFISQVAQADTHTAVVETLRVKSEHAHNVSKYFAANGMRHYMFS